MRDGRVRAALLAVAAMAATLAACSGGGAPAAAPGSPAADATGGSPGARRKIKIALIAKSSTNPV
ncbi:MAG TPA: lactonase family protein, partial [Vicinamibacteria bacterium]|nr:lactonase family protein [Vicinamibacteria bacterium]